MPTPHWQRRSATNPVLYQAYTQTREIGYTWAQLQRSHLAASRIALSGNGDPAAGSRDPLSDADCYRLTIERICQEVDEQIGVRHVAKAALAWLVCETTYAVLKYRLFGHKTMARSEMGDLLDAAIAHFFLLAVLQRGITGEFREDAA